MPVKSLAQRKKSRNEWIEKIISDLSANAHDADEDSRAAFDQAYSNFWMALGYDHPSDQRNLLIKALRKKFPSFVGRQPPAIISRIYCDAHKRSISGASALTRALTKYMMTYFSSEAFLLKLKQNRQDAYMEFKAALEADKTAQKLVINLLIKKLPSWFAQDTTVAGAFILHMLPIATPRQRRALGRVIMKNLPLWLEQDPLRALTIFGWVVENSAPDKELSALIRYMIPNLRSWTALAKDSYRWQVEGIYAQAMRKAGLEQAIAMLGHADVVLPDESLTCAVTERLYRLGRQHGKYNRHGIILGDVFAVSVPSPYSEHDKVPAYHTAIIMKGNKAFIFNGCFHGSIEDLENSIETPPGGPWDDRAQRFWKRMKSNADHYRDVIQLAKKLEARARHQLKTGKLIKGQGIYLGTWEPKDKNGRTLGKIFDVYAAPTDLKYGKDKLIETFNNTVKHVARLKNYHGHDGGNFANQDAVLKAVRKNPAALERWFLPTKELQHGKTADGAKIQPANLHDSRNKGAFKKPFVPKRAVGDPRQYWSLTEHPTIPRLVHVYGLTAAGFVGEWCGKNFHIQPARVVRAVLRP